MRCVGTLDEINRELPPGGFSGPTCCLQALGHSLLGDSEFLSRLILVEAAAHQRGSLSSLHSALIKDEAKECKSGRDVIGFSCATAAVHLCVHVAGTG